MMNTLYDKEVRLDLPDAAKSEQFAVQLGNCLKPGLTLCFSGEIGAGKTTIIRAMLKSLGVESTIKSPTFSLVESYLCTLAPVHHFDLYRIEQEDELEYLGFRDYFSTETICCIEWPEHAGKALPMVDIRFKLTSKGAGREMHMCALSAAGERILACLAGE